MDSTILGIDLAKNTMHVHLVDARGDKLLSRKIIRKKLTEFVANLEPTTIAMEACGGANYWARTFKTFGHTVKLIHPKFVKAYLKTNKNDAKDAEAICEAASRSSMNFVAPKSLEQQDMQCLHKSRKRLVKSRTYLVNQLRGFLQEYGIVFPKNIQNVAKHLPAILEDASNGLTTLMREHFHEMYFETKEISLKIDKLTKQLVAISESNPICKRIKKIEGIGPITSTAMLTVMSDPSLFKNGRHFSAFLGLVPKQNSTGGKSTLLGISKRGNKYLRTMLIHGARSVVVNAANKTDKRSLWINKLKETRGFNKACVALANKNARIIWAVLDSNEEYRAAV